jgi:glutamine amidotransferase
VGVTRVVVLDYGSGNLRSAQRALERVGAQVSVTADARAAIEADGLVVPGVGAFAACMAGLLGVDGPAILAARLAAERPVLGICCSTPASSTASRRRAWRYCPAASSR